MSATKIKPPFTKDDFVNGDIKGYPFDNPINPRGAPWARPEKKAKAANDLAVFLAADCPRELFTEDAYDGLHQHMFGHIAEFTLGGFYNTWFSTPEQRAAWVEYAYRGGVYGFHSTDRPELWGDVERMIVAWLKSTGIGNRLIQQGEQHTEDLERAELARLKEKYGE